MFLKWNLWSFPTLTSKTRVFLKNQPLCDCRVPWRASQIPIPSLPVIKKNSVRCWWQKVNVSVNRESTFRFDEVAAEQSQPLFPQWVKWVASRTDLSVNKNNSPPVSGDATNYRHLTRRLALIAIVMGLVRKFWRYKFYEWPDWWCFQNQLENYSQWKFKIATILFRKSNAKTVFSSWHHCQLIQKTLSQRITLNCDLVWCFCSLSPSLNRNEASSDDFKGF